MNEERTIKQRLMAKIRAGEVSMHSKGYFALRLVALSICITIAIIASILIFNFIFFSFRVSERAELLGFGSRGLFFFLAMFPWKLLLIDMVFLFAADRLLRHFRLGYRYSVLTLLIMLLVVALALGFVLDRATPLNDRLFERAHGHHLGPINELYESAPRPWPVMGSICKCTIVELGTTIRAQHVGATSTFELVLPAGFATSTLRIGDVVFVIGDRDDRGVLHVHGIHAKSGAH